MHFRAPVQRAKQLVMSILLVQTGCVLSPPNAAPIPATAQCLQIVAVVTYASTRRAGLRQLQVHHLYLPYHIALLNQVTTNRQTACCCYLHFAPSSALCSVIQSHSSHSLYCTPSQSDPLLQLHQLQPPPQRLRPRHWPNQLKPNASICTMLAVKKAGAPTNAHTTLATAHSPRSRLAALPLM